LIKTTGINRDSSTLNEDKNKDAIELERVYDFSDEAQALLFAGAGWSNASSNGARWNAKNKGSLSFKVMDNKSPLDLIVQSGPFFAKGKHELQAIEAMLPSGTRQLIKLQYGHTDGRFVIHVEPGDIDTDGSVVIELRFLNAASPKSLEINNDPRLLAIKVKTLQVVISEGASN
jgi:hypothetical protein